MINIFFCGNDKAFDGILISTLSLVKHTKKAIALYILTADFKDEKNKPISEFHESYINKILTTVNKNSFAKLLDISDIFVPEMRKNPNFESFYTPYCMLRLYADKIPELPDKIIYLDTDIVLRDDISLLFNIDVSNYELGAVEDYLGKWFKHRGYINSGVLLLNLSMIRETGLFEKTRKKCAEKKMWFPDQDALNKVLSKKLMLDKKFNSQHKGYPDTVIRHFCKTIRLLPFYHTENIKPWQIDQVHKTLKTTEFDDILNDYLKRIERIKSNV